MYTNKASKSEKVIRSSLIRRTDGTLDQVELVHGMQVQCIARTVINSHAAVYFLSPFKDTQTQKSKPAG